MNASPADIGFDPCGVVERRSVHVHCRIEEDKHKWIESEKAQQDKGEAAIRDWVRHHWDDYLRYRWIEHLEGECFWIELDRGDFGLLKRHIRDRHDQFDTVVDKLKRGYQNLNVICWAADDQKQIDPIHDILLLIDINSRRLPHRFDDPNYHPDHN